MNIRLALTVLLVILVGLLIAGSIFLYYNISYRPGQLHTQATATIVAAKTTSSAQTSATTLAQNRATATVVMQATSVAVATQIALGDLYNHATAGTPALNDDLRGPNNHNWRNDQPPDSTGGCVFADNIYHVKAASGYFANCQAGATNFSNLAFQIDMNILSGHSGGLMIRANNDGSGYYFRISSDGTFLGKGISIKSQVGYPTPLFVGQSPAIHTGNNQFNQITVIAQGSNLYMYVNQQFIATMSDNTYKAGQIGVYTDSDASGAEILFRNAQVWKL